MAVFAYLISDDLQDLYIYIKKKKKRAMGHRHRATPLALSRPGSGER